MRTTNFILALTLLVSAVACEVSNAGEHEESSRSAGGAATDATSVDSVQATTSPLSIRAAVSSDASPWPTASCRTT